MVPAPYGSLAFLAITCHVDWFNILPSIHAWDSGIIRRLLTTSILRCFLHRWRSPPSIHEYGRPLMTGTHTYGCIWQQTAAARLFDQEFHGDQWTAFDPGPQIPLATELLMNGGHDLAALRLLQDGSGPGGQIGAYTLLKVKGKLGVRQQVGIPIATSWSPRNVQAPLDIVEPDLCTAELPGFPARGRDVDGAIAFQGLFYRFVHTPSPTIKQDVQGTRPSPCRISAHSGVKMPVTTSMAPPRLASSMSRSTV